MKTDMQITEFIRVHNANTGTVFKWIQRIPGIAYKDDQGRWCFPAEHVEILGRWVKASNDFNKLKKRLRQHTERAGQ